MAEFVLKDYPMEEFSGLYARMERDFPRNERPGRLQLKGLLDRGACHALGLYRDGAFAGYALYARQGPDILITFLAIEPEMRGAGCGSALLNLLSERFQDAACLILEVEHPNFAQDEAERQTRLRRIAFYERAGFRLMRDIRYSAFGVQMLLMARAMGQDFSAIRARIIPAMGHLYARLLPRILIHNILLEEIPPCSIKGYTP